MHKLNFQICLFLLLIFASIINAQQETLPQIIKRVKPAVVAVITYDRKGEKLARGSGFFISNNRIVTNRHVIESAYSVEIELYDNKTFKINGVIGTDDAGDLAILEVAVPLNYKVTPLNISQTKIEEGERVLVIGNPLGLEGTISDGLVSSIRESSTIGKIIQITAPISPGSSGSPVINLKGIVIGIATSQLTKGQNLNFAMPSTRIPLIKINKLQAFRDYQLNVLVENFSKADIEYQKGRAILEDGFKKYCTLPTDQKSGKCDVEALKNVSQQALPFFITAVEIYPEMGRAWKEIGDAYSDAGKVKDAINAYNKAIKIDSKDWGAWQNLANRYHDLKDFESAINCWDKVFLYGPKGSTTVIAAINMGYIFSKDLNNEEKAILAYKKGLGIMKVPSKEEDSLKNRLMLSLISRGLELSEKEQHYQAIDIFREIILLDLKSKAGAYRFIGDEYYYLKMYSDAASSYREAIALNPNFYKAWSDLAAAYLQLDNMPLVISASKESVRIKPDYDYGHYYLGLGYYFNGNKNLAYEEYRILQPLNSELATKLLNLLNK